MYIKFYVKFRYPNKGIVKEHISITVMSYIYDQRVYGKVGGDFFSFFIIYSW